MSEPLIAPPPTVQELASSVKAGDAAKVRILLHTKPELIGTDMSGGNEHRALHFAVLNRDPGMVRLLMESGADARKGIWPHRDATSALVIARDREYHEIVAVIEEEERLRREELSCPNSTISPIQDQINTAISGEDNQLAIQLLETDLSLIHACDRQGATPLHRAAREGNMVMLEWLLRRNAKVNKLDLRSHTPLDVAALAFEPGDEGAAAFPAVAKLLLQHGAELTIIGATALGNELRVREMLEIDPSLLRRIEQNGGLLTLAVNHGQVEIIKLLLNLGADVDERIMLDQVETPTPSWGMPLWHAALANRYDISEILLDHGADPNANVYASGWPLRNAWNHEGGAVKNLLLARGAKPQPYMVSEAHDVGEAKRLLDAGATEELARELAWSAADSGCSEIVSLALPYLGWPPSDPQWHWVIIQPMRGATANHASREGHFKSLIVLLRHGVDANITRFGQTPLHFTAGYHGSVSNEDRARFAALLIDYGASLSLRDDLLKSTPLGWACRWGRQALAKELIARGAPINETDAEPWATPTAWAKKMNQQATLTMLSQEP